MIHGKYDFLLDKGEPYSGPFHISESDRLLVDTEIPAFRLRTQTEKSCKKPRPEQLYHMALNDCDTDFTMKDPSRRSRHAVHSLVGGQSWGQASCDSFGRLAWEACWTDKLARETFLRLKVEVRRGPADVQGYRLTYRAWELRVQVHGRSQTDGLQTRLKCARAYWWFEGLSKRLLVLCGSSCCAFRAGFPSSFLRLLV
ncbi:hypothetical protein H920_04205 [Fukomys damarensis]|uniref:Uncharacterized protein n=1 Tax=Fukomys damarensis TaxID=885580 RepID=A0A091DV75_FUKDA|nr:hypothetical protein H920_04205 [Fukomys damarensis]